jgi:hypothetical protein
VYKSMVVNRDERLYKKAAFAALRTVEKPLGGRSSYLFPLVKIVAVRRVCGLIRIGLETGEIDPLQA